MEKPSLNALPFVQDILNNHDFKSLKNFTHHGKTSCYHHTLSVAKVAYIIAFYLRLDYVAATRGALLHDFFLYNWRTDGPRLHGFRHPRIALNNASKHFVLGPKEKDSILRHMWPLTPLPPRYLESWIVCIADKLVSTKDYINFIQTQAALLFSIAKNNLSKIMKTFISLVQSPL